MQMRAKLKIDNIMEFVFLFHEIIHVFFSLICVKIYFYMKQWLRTVGLDLCKLWFDHKKVISFEVS